MDHYLADIWLLLMGFFLLCYAITDGSNLGVGLISIFSNDESERSLMMAAVSNTWHGNQTWLVLIGGMLFGAFPLFFATLLSALYVPMLIMLVGLISRGVAFEFRQVASAKRRWGWAFSFGSLIVTLAQGFALGALLGGLEVQTGQFTGTAWGWLTPASTLVAAGVVSGYTMLGANYLIMKTSGDLQLRCFRYSLATAIPTVLIAVAVHLWLVFTYPQLLRKWTSLPDCFYVAGFPLLTLFAIAMYFKSLSSRREFAPLIWNAAIILFSFTGVSVGLYPHMIPQVLSPSITVYRAAASPGTLKFMFVVIAILIPVIFAYTAYVYWVFRGKVDQSTYAGNE